MAVFTVRHAMSGEMAAKTGPVGTTLISGGFDPETYATGGVTLTAAIVNTGLASFGAQFTVASVDNVVVHGDEIDGTYYAEWIRTSGKVKVSNTADETEVSNATDLSDVPFPMTIAVTLA